jgi:hypothetical protein
MLTKIEVVEEEVQSNESVAEEEELYICDCPDCPECAGNGKEEYPCQSHGCDCKMCCNGFPELA